MQSPADEDVLKVTRFFKKHEKVTESKIPKPGPKTKMQITDLKRRQTGGRKHTGGQWGEERWWGGALGRPTRLLHTNGTGEGRSGIVLTT